jgi:hypothetical protein
VRVQYVPARIIEAGATKVSKYSKHIKMNKAEMAAIEQQWASQQDALCMSG